MIGLLVIAAIIGGIFLYSSWLTKGIQPRRVVTKLSVDQLDAIFTQSVAGKGWKIVDDGNPMIAQSPLVTGIRQRIAMETVRHDDQTVAHIGPTRIVRKWYGTPTKGHTLRLRMDAFERRVKSMDGQATIVRDS